MLVECNIKRWGATEMHSPYYLEIMRLNPNDPTTIYEIGHDLQVGGMALLCSVNQNFTSQLWPSVKSCV